MKAGFFSMMIERSFNPNNGTGSESDRMTPYFGNNCFRMSLFKPLEKLLLPITSYIASSERY
jgi:hypothetical protein